MLGWKEYKAALKMKVLNFYLFIYVLILGLAKETYSQHLRTWRLPGLEKSVSCVGG